MTRKQFNDATGKHVVRPETLGSTAEIFEPAPHVVAALEVACPICNAKPGVQCGSIIDASKNYEPPHAGRIEAARSRRPRFAPIVKTIGACVLCDSGAMIAPEDIAAALDADRGAGFRDPTPEEVELLVAGDDDGAVPPELRAAHPALDALLAREMT